MTSRVVKIKKQTLDRVVRRNDKIKSCRGVYSAISTAKYFNVTRKTVYELWKTEGPDDVEPPNIKTDNRSREDIYADACILLGRGLGLDEAARQLGTDSRNLANILRSRPTGRELLWRHQDAMKAWRRGRSDPRGSRGPNWEGDDRCYSWANEI